MQTKTGKLISLLLTLAMATALFAGTQTAALAANTDVAISQGETVAQIQNKIQNAIDDAASGDSVTVTGSKTGVDGENLVLTIPAGVTVKWGAAYKAEVNYDFWLILLYGEGTFEVTQGGDLLAYDDAIWVSDEADGLSIIVNGGTVSSAAYHAIAVYGVNCNVTVNNGKVEFTGGVGYAIYSDYGDVTVNGGTVTAEENESVAINTETGNVMITGGTVTANGDSSVAIGSFDGNITVSGGTVTAAGNGSTALYAYQGYIKVTGGAVSAPGTGSNAIYVENYGAAAYLRGTCTGGFQVDEYSGYKKGMIVEIDSLTIPKSRNATTEGMDIKVGDDGRNQVEWDTTGAKPVIEFLIGGEVEHSIEWGDYPGAAVAPGITGPTSMSLNTGYAAASTGAYTVTGTPAPTVTKTSGDAKITWNDTTKKLDIAAGLAEGTYTVTLKAGNGTSPDATLTFTLTVNPANPPEPGPTTGDNSNMFLWLWIGGAAGMTLAGLVMAGRRGKNPRKF